MITINSVESTYSKQKLIGPDKKSLLIEATGDVEEITISFSTSVNQFIAFSPSFISLNIDNNLIQDYNYSSIITSQSKSGNFNIYTLDLTLNLKAKPNASGQLRDISLIMQLNNLASSESSTIEPITLSQPSSGQLELASILFHNTTPVTPLNANGSTNTSLFVVLSTNYIDPDSIYITFSNTLPGWGDDFEYIITPVTSPDTNRTIRIYLKSYKPNYSAKAVTAVMTIHGTSLITGNSIVYSVNDAPPVLTNYFIKRQNGNVSNLNLEVTPEDLVFDFTGGQQTFRVTVDNLTATPLSSIRVYSDSTDISVTSISPVTSHSVLVTINSLYGDNEISGKLTVESTYSSETKTNYVTYKRTASPGSIYLASWQDFYVQPNFGPEGYVKMEIWDLDNNTQVYSGSIYRSENSSPQVNITPIISPYVSANIYFEDADYNFDGQELVCNHQTEHNFTRLFYVVIENNVTNVIHLYYNWTFNNNFLEVLLNNRRSNISNPIQNLIDGRQYIFLSRYFLNDDYLEDLTDLYFYKEGETTSVINASVTSGGNMEHSITRLKDKSGNWQKDLVRAELKFDGRKIKDYCICWKEKYDLCLYYINSYGGIDWYLFNKSSKRNLSSSTSTYERDTPNTNINHSIINYQNVLTESWELHSDLMNDKQSELFMDVFESPVVYLHDLKNDKIIPVNIATNSYERKTFISNGKKMIQYNLKVEKAQKNVYRF